VKILGGELVSDNVGGVPGLGEYGEGGGGSVDYSKIVGVRTDNSSYNLKKGYEI